MKEYQAPELTMYVFRAEDVLGPSQVTTGDDETKPIFNNNFAD